MEITEVRIKLMEDSEDRLRAFCSITLDGCFVVRDLKIIEGSQGPFVAMPSRKLTGRCHRCSHKNHLRSHYCNQCGTRLRESREQRDEDAHGKLYADVAHPINQACRDLIQSRVVEEYKLELQRAQQPGYVSRYDDAYEPTDLPGAPAIATGEARNREAEVGRLASGPVARSGAVVPTPHLLPLGGASAHAHPSLAAASHQPASTPQVGAESPLASSSHASDPGDAARPADTHAQQASTERLDAPE